MNRQTLSTRVAEHLQANEAPHWQTFGQRQATAGLVDGDADQLLAEIGAALGSGGWKLTLVAASDAEGGITATRSVHVDTVAATQILFGLALGLHTTLKAAATTAGLSFTAPVAP